MLQVLTIKAKNLESNVMNASVAYTCCLAVALFLQVDLVPPIHHLFLVFIFFFFPIFRLKSTEIQISASFAKIRQNIIKSISDSINLISFHCRIETWHTNNSSINCDFVFLHFS